MKLNQKLAVILASAMTITSVPTITMAASTNTLVKDMLKVKENTKFVDITTSNMLKIKFTDNNENAEIFYLELDNAKWDEKTLWEASQNPDNHFKPVKVDGEVALNKNEVEAYIYQDAIRYERQSDSIMMVTIESNQFTHSDTTMRLPIFAEVEDGEAKISVVTRGGETTVSAKSFVFATTAEKRISVDAKSNKTFYTSGVLSDITIDEDYAGALNVEGGTTFTVELCDTDFYFTGDFEAEYKYGLSGKTEEVKGEVQSDRSIMKFTIPQVSGNTRGSIVLKNIKVKSKNRHPDTGDFTVDIKGDDLTKEKNDLLVAKVSEYGVYVKMKNDKVKDIKAGRKEEVEFEIGEGVEDSMMSGREFEMTLSNGYWDYKQLVKDAASAHKLDGKVDGKSYSSSKDYSDEDYKEWAAQINPTWLAKELLDNDSDWSSSPYCEAEFDTDRDGLALPETILFTPGKYKKDKDDERNILKFKTKICIPINMKEKSKVTLTVSGRGISGDDVSETVFNIVNPFNVTYEQAVLKTGKQGQVSGEVTIKETEKDCLQKGDIVFRITKDDEDFNIYLTDADVEVSSGLRGTKVDVKKGKTSSNAKINLTLNRTSKEPATITFKNLTFTTDRTVPQGTYDLEISGKAIDADAGYVDDDENNAHTIIVKDFIKISTANTEDITTSGLSKGVVKFVIGEYNYTIDDKEVVMDAPSFIQAPGYTMVSARYLAQAFGVKEGNILFNKGTVTIFAGERTINLTTGSNIAIVNGNPISMTTAVVNVNGRTYLPASQLASLLGIRSNWDSTTKTATFENN